MFGSGMPLIAMGSVETAAALQAACPHLNYSPALTSRGWRFVLRLPLKSVMKHDGNSQSVRCGVAFRLGVLPAAKAEACKRGSPLRFWHSDEARTD